jgi:hypothetical protein
VKQKGLMSGLETFDFLRTEWFLFWMINKRLFLDLRQSHGWYCVVLFSNGIIFLKQAKRVFWGDEQKERQKTRAPDKKSGERQQSCSRESPIFILWFWKKNLESGNLKFDQVTIGAVFHELILGSKEDEKSNSKNDLLKTETKKWLVANWNTILKITISWSYRTRMQYKKKTTSCLNPSG